MQDQLCNLFLAFNSDNLSEPPRVLLAQHLGYNEGGETLFQEPGNPSITVLPLWRDVYSITFTNLVPSLQPLP